MPKRVLNNVKLMWCNFTSKDQYGNYGAKLIFDDETVSRLEGWGITVKEDEDGKFLQIRRNKDGNGDELPAPTVVDSNMQPIPSGIQVGNGSIANVRVDVYEYKRYGGGVACRLDSVQVTNLIPYGDDEGFEPVESQDAGGTTESSENPF